MVACVLRRAQPDADALRGCVPGGRRGGRALGGVGSNGDVLLRACHEVPGASVS